MGYTMSPCLKKKDKHGGLHQICNHQHLYEEEGGADRTIPREAPPVSNQETRRELPHLKSVSTSTSAPPCARTHAHNIITVLGKLRWWTAELDGSLDVF